MKGTTVKRGKSWSICYYIGKNEHGKWIQKWESGFPTQREAQKALRSRVEAVESSRSNNLSCATVSGFLNYWLDTYCKQNLAPNTIRGYRVNVEKHIIPYIGNIPLIKLTPKNIQDLYTRLISGGLSGTSTRYVHNNLHKAFSYAVKLQALPRNPTDLVEPPKITRHEAATLTPEEVLRLLTACGSSDLGTPVLLAVALGLRRGEALALRWDDIDLDNRVAVIRHSALCERLDSFQISDTKTRTSRRAIRLPEYVATVLQARLDLLKERRKTLGKSYNALDLVCFRETGQPYTSNVLQHQYKKLLQSAGLPDIRFHDLRHTNATLMLRNGIPAKVVSSMLGHSSIQLTMDTYSHVLPDMQEGAADAMDKLLTGLC